MIIKFAQDLAEWVHRDQMYGDKPYTFHLKEVSSICWRMYSGKENEESLQVISYLHDSVEDCDIDFHTLLYLGFPMRIVESIDAITKRVGETQSEYLERVAQDKDATKVKLVDSYSNMIQSEIDGDEDRAKYYKKSIKRLLGKIDDHELIKRWGEKISEV